MSEHRTSRREFLRTVGAAAATALPVGVVELAWADPAHSFTFAYISDSHIQHIEGARFVRNWDRGLIRGGAR